MKQAGIAQGVFYEVSSDLDGRMDGTGLASKWGVDGCMDGDESLPLCLQLLSTVAL